MAKLRFKLIKIDRPNTSKIIGALVIGFALLLISLLGYENAERNGIYSGNWRIFQYSISQKYAPQECFSIGPNTLTLDTKSGKFNVVTYFTKKCNFTEAYVNLEVTYIVKYEIKNEGDLVLYPKLNLTTSTLILVVNSSDMVLNANYPIFMSFQLNTSNGQNAIYSRHFFETSESGAQLGEIAILYDDGLGGYYCDKDCHSILKGNLEMEETGHVGGTLSKRFAFKNENKVIIDTAPRNKSAILFQKIAEGIFIGLVIFMFTKILEAMAKAE